MNEAEKLKIVFRKSSVMIQKKVNYNRVETGKKFGQIFARSQKYIYTVFMKFF